MLVTERGSTGERGFEVARGVEVVVPGFKEAAFLGQDDGRLVRISDPLRGDQLLMSVELAQALLRELQQALDAPVRDRSVEIVRQGYHPLPLAA